MKRSQWVTWGAMIAALYVVLTLMANALGLASMAIQIRFSEALTVLPFFTSAAIPGLFLGCLISNLLIGAMLPDVIFGSLATLTGAVGTYLIGVLAAKRNQRSEPHMGSEWRTHNQRRVHNQWRWLAPIPPIAANVIIIPHLLAYIYHLEGGLPYFVITVGVGEVVSCGALGMALLLALEKYEKVLFGEK